MGESQKPIGLVSGFFRLSLVIIVESLFGLILIRGSASGLSDSYVSLGAGAIVLYFLIVYIFACLLINLIVGLTYLGKARRLLAKIAISAFSVIYTIILMVLLFFAGMIMIKDGAKTKDFSPEILHRLLAC